MVINGRSEGRGGRKVLGTIASSRSWESIGASFVVKVSGHGEVEPPLECEGLMGGVGSEFDNPSQGGSGLSIFWYRNIQVDVPDSLAFVAALALLGGALWLLAEA